MRYRPLGMSGIQASVVGMGTWVTGGGAVWGEDPSDEESVRAIHAALDLGVNLIDTAPAYGWGRSEEVVGRAIRGRRDQVVIATKCGLWWKDERGAYFSDLNGKPIRRSLRPDTIQIEVEESLRRLGTDSIDLYQTHWPATEPEKTPIADTMACLMRLKDQGKIRAIGCSNVSVEELEEYDSSGDLSSNQFRYSILYREPERDILPYCERRGIATLTYMSLEQGLLTGRIGMDRKFGKDEWRSNEAWMAWYKPENRRKVLDMLDGWRPLAEKHSSTLAQLVIAWTAAQPGVTHVLCGARTASQIAETAAAADLSIAPEDLDRMGGDAERLGRPA